MAKIQNQAVIQKLIDELELYPAKDVIPTELADKILPVFQINSENINLNVTENIKVYRDATINENDRTILVPDGKKWKIKVINCFFDCSAAANNRIIMMQILDKDGNVFFTTETPAAIEPTQEDNMAFYENAITSDTATMDADKGFQHIAIPPLTLNEGFGIRIYDAADRDAAADDMITSVLVDEQDF